jgi:hypothetical protein
VHARAHRPPPQRRDVLSALLATAAAGAAAPAPPAAALGLPFEFFDFQKPTNAALPPNTVRDETLAYQFTYPSVIASGRALPVTVSRKPEKYSSAAPLTADARQRIVAELVSLQAGVTYSVYVGPATGALKGVPPSAWTPEAVAKVVLTDRSAVRSTDGHH